MKVRCEFDAISRVSSVQIEVLPGSECDTLLRTYTAGPRRKGALRVLAPYGRERLGPGWHLSLDITTALPHANIIDTPYRIRNSRQLTARALQLAAARPDLIVVGGFHDWIVQENVSQPFVEIDEFAVRINWAADLLCRDFKIPLVFIYGGPVGDGFEPARGWLHLQSVAEIYLRSLHATSGRVNLFKVFDASSHFAKLSTFPVSPFGERPPALSRRADRDCSAHFATCVRAAIKSGSWQSRFWRWGRDSGSNHVGEPEPHSKASKDSWLRPVDRQLALPRSLVITEEAEQSFALEPIWQRLFGVALKRSGELESEGIDEGASSSGKDLDQLGGRNFFERSIQFRICMWLRQHYRRGNPRVMIIGDSVRMRIANGTGYGIVAYQHLIDRCNIIHIPHNCGSSAVGVAHIENWLSANPDIIHANHGLHDLALSDSSGGHASTYNSPLRFESNLRRIVELIRTKSSASLIWGLCTPVDEEWHGSLPGQRGSVRSVIRNNDDVRRYNEISARVMEDFNVPVTDLFTPLYRAGIRANLLSDGVHLNSRGAVVVGRLVADAIGASLQGSMGTKRSASQIHLATGDV